MASLNDYTWAEISSIASSGKAKSTFAIGDTKDITLTTGEVITARIIGFDHDELSDGSGKAGITFNTVELVANGKHTDSYSTNIPWSSSLIRTSLQPDGTVYATLPDDLISVIKQVKKRSAYGDGNTCTTDDYLFLLSMNEVYGSTDIDGEEIGSNATFIFPAEQDGHKYEYFVGDTVSTSHVKKRKKKIGATSNSSWWLRTGAGINNTPQTFMYIDAYGSSDYQNNSRNDGISFCFCLGAPNAPTFTPADFLRWFSMGQAVRRAVAARREATMYSYNGVVLPKLPSVVGYEYMVLSGYERNQTLYCWKSKPPTVLHDNGYDYIDTSKDDPFMKATFWGEEDAETWTDFGESYGNFPLSTILWANFDVYTSDGALYLAKSDPVPVYE